MQIQKLALKTETILSGGERERRLKQHLNSSTPTLTSLLQDITFQSQMASFQVQFPSPTSQSYLFCLLKEENLEYLTLFGILISQPSYYASLTLDYFPKPLFIIFVNVMWLQ